MEEELLCEDFPGGMHNHVRDDLDEVLLRCGSVIVDPLGQVIAGPDVSGETMLAAGQDMRELRAVSSTLTSSALMRDPTSFACNAIGGRTSCQHARRG